MEPWPADAREAGRAMTLDEARAFIADWTSTYAKTMPQWPHEYIIKDKRPDQAERFEGFARFILAPSSRPCALPVQSVASSPRNRGGTVPASRPFTSLSTRTAFAMVAAAVGGVSRVSVPLRRSHADHSEIQPPDQLPAARLDSVMR